MRICFTKAVNSTFSLVKTSGCVLDNVVQHIWRHNVDGTVTAYIRHAPFLQDEHVLCILLFTKQHRNDENVHENASLVRNVHQLHHQTIGELCCRYDR